MNEFAIIKNKTMMNGKIIKTEHQSANRKKLSKNSVYNWDDG